MPPLTSTFLADFESFYTACQSAEKGLEGIEQESLATAKQIDTMVGRFRGDKVVAEADAMIQAVEKLGGATRLTDQEFAKLQATATAAAQKLTAAGATVPENMQKYATSINTVGASMSGLVPMAKNLAASLGLVFSVQSVLQYGKHVLATADSLIKLSETTGMSIAQVQQLSYVAEQSGNTIQELSDASGKLAIQLANPKAQAAIEDLGLSFAALKAAKPYDQLEMIADAFKTIPPEVNETEAAVALFGESGRKILPTLKSDFRALADEVVAASDEQVIALDAMGDALSRLMTKTTNLAVGVAGSFALAAEQVGELGFLKSLGLLITQGPSAVAALAELRAANLALAKAERDRGDQKTPPVEPLVAYRAELDKLRASFVNLTAEEKDTIEEGNKLNQGAALIAAGIGKPVAAVQQYIDGLKKAKTESDKYSAAQLEMASAGGTWQQTLEEIDGELIAAAKNYLKAGVSQQALADFYGLTATQIKAVATALKEEQEALKQTEKIEEDLAAMRREYQTELIARLGTDTDVQKAEIAEWRDAARAALEETGAATTAHYAEIEAIAAEKLAAVGINWGDLRDAAGTANQETADSAERTYQYALDHINEFTAEGIAKLHELRDAAAAAATLDTGDDQQVRIDQAYKAYADMYAKVGDSGSAAVQKLWTEYQNVLTGAESVAEEAAAGFTKATGAAQSYAITLHNLSSAQLEATARMHEFDAAANRMSGEGGAFWHASTIAAQQEEMARKAREAAGKAKVREAYGTEVWGRGGSTSTSTVNINVATGRDQDIANSIVTSMRHEGIRL